MKHKEDQSALLFELVKNLQPQVQPSIFQMHVFLKICVLPIVENY